MSATALSYITINGLKLTVREWHPSKPAGAAGIGIGGDAWLSRGAVSLKWSWDFIARFQYTPASGYAAKSDVELWATSSLAGYLTMIDVYGQTYSVQWESAWNWNADTNESAGVDEWYEVKVHLRQK